jgi:cyclopropane-fatty-acyl-phospholipid synthase
MIDRGARAIVLGALRRLRGGELHLVERGKRLSFGELGGPSAMITVHDPRIWRSFLRGSFGLARSYADGAWDCEDLVALTRIAARNARGLDRARAWAAPFRHPIQRVASAAHAPTIRRSRRQIAAHYDLGNDLFALFLDETMSYSAGYFESPGATLYQASITKLDRVCLKLGLRPSDHVLEIGSGWGGFAVYAARKFGCRVTTTTISTEQYELAVQRVRAAGLENRVKVLLKDYRQLRGSYDKLVSIEMIEAVGWQYFETYFERCSELLRPGGAMLLQAITIDERAYEVEKGGRSFINTLIFPGGCLPSRAVIERCVSGVTDLRTIGFEDMTPHYVRTLACWRERFEASCERVAELGYDERFRRLWTLFLCYCEGGFEERRIEVGQHVFVKQGLPLAKQIRPHPAPERRRHQQVGVAGREGE